MRRNNGLHRNSGLYRNNRLYRNDGFGGLNPIAVFIQLGVSAVFSMLIINPVSLLISFAAAFSYAYRLRGRSALKILRMTVFAALICAVINPLFNHGGETILAYFQNGNPLTLESVAYGIAAGAMLVCAVLWFSCFNAVMTSDRLCYLFGRAAPTLSLVFSMMLRFVPRFAAQMRAAVYADRGIAKTNKIKNAAAAAIATINRSLEGAVEISDSMRSRGYGLRKRTAFSVYGFSRLDAAVTAVTVLLTAIVTALYARGGMKFSYFPRLEGDSSALSVTAFTVYALLLSVPLIVNAVEF